MRGRRRIEALDALLGSEYPRHLWLTLYTNFTPAFTFPSMQDRVGTHCPPWFRQ
jgi:hypothetical protein